MNRPERLRGRFGLASRVTELDRILRRLAFALWRRTPLPPSFPAVLNEALASAMMTPRIAVEDRPERSALTVEGLDGTARTIRLYIEIDPQGTDPAERLYLEAVLDLIRYGELPDSRLSRCHL